MHVLIADDHSVVRRGVRQIIQDEFPGSLVSEASTAGEALDLARMNSWDIAIIDIGLPDRNGIEVLRDLKQEFPHHPVVILSMHPEDQFAVRVMRDGACAYITKESAADELRAAILAGLDGRKYLTPAQMEKIAGGVVGEEPRESIPKLSDREYEVLMLLAVGKTVTEISEQLNRSVKTVSTYRTRLLAKLDARTNVELVSIARGKGIIPL